VDDISNRMVIDPRRHRDRDRDRDRHQISIEIKTRDSRITVGMAIAGGLKGGR
jgi:hypothetical protein